jgi:glucose-1-phosphate cytidylyltransferase
VKSIEHIGKSGAMMNGGFMVLRQEIFNYMRDGEELVEEPFRRLIDDRMLMAYPHEGFWACMDTFKEKQDLDDVFSQGNAPWAVWNNAGVSGNGMSMTHRSHPIAATRQRS